MSINLSKLILSLVPEDGSSIENGALFARLRDHVTTLTDDEYVAVRDELIEAGTLGRGQGRGVSIYRADVTDMELTQPVDQKARSMTVTRKKPASKAVGPAEILSYRHDATRVNNPEVGMVHADTDPDGEKTQWQYDPHLDPVLNFDSTRGSIEKLIDDALASDDPERMKDALSELKRLQAPYLNWTGKAEKTSFEVDTVSLHVHERVDPATILANAAKRLKGKASPFDPRQGNLFAAPFENLPLLAEGLRRPRRAPLGFSFGLGEAAEPSLTTPTSSLAQADLSAAVTDIAVPVFDTAQARPFLFRSWKAQGLYPRAGEGRGRHDFRGHDILRAALRHPASGPAAVQARSRLGFEVAGGGALARDPVSLASLLGRQLYQRAGSMLILSLNFATPPAWPTSCAASTRRPTPRTWIAAITS